MTWTVLKRSLVLLSCATAVGTRRPAAQTGSPAFSHKKVMVPVRDGVRLQTVILAPADAVPAAADSVSPHALRRAGEART